MHAAAIRFDLHIPDARSLKAKRAVLRPIVDAIRHRFRLSVAEVDHHDLWQRAAIGVAIVADRASRLDELVESVERFVMHASDVELVDITRSELIDDSSTLEAW